MIPGEEKFRISTSSVKGGVATAIVVTAFFLQAKAQVYVPTDVLDKMPENTLAIAFAGSLTSLWNAGKFFLRRWKSRKGML